jgi:hypothetical protein
MVWLTSLDDDCCGGCLESCSIFFLNMGQSFVPWLLSLPSNMQYGGLNVYRPRLGALPL